MDNSQNEGIKNDIIENKDDIIYQILAGSS